MYETVSASQHYTNNEMNKRGATLRTDIQRYINLYATFVDEGFDEQSNDAVSHYTDYLCRIFVDQPDDDADYAANNALSFAYRVCFHLAPDAAPPVINLTVYNKTLVDRLGTMTTEEARRDTMSLDSSQYLYENPLVDQLIAEYIEAIDPTGEWAELARTVAGLSFLQFELSADEEYVQQNLHSLDQELRDFGSTSD